RGRLGDHHRWLAGGLAGRLGPGTCVQHHAGAGVALRSRQRGGAEADPADLPPAVAGRESSPETALLKAAGPDMIWAAANRGCVGDPIAGPFPVPPSARGNAPAA